MPLPTRAAAPPLNPEIDRLLYQVQVIREEAAGLVQGLRDDQFHWSPGPGEWSMAQCFDHLNVAGDQMVKAIGAAVSKARAEGRLDDGPYAYNWISRFFLRLIGPPVKRKFKAPGTMEPGPRLSLEDVMARWNQLHDRQESGMRDSSGVDLAGVKVSSPVTSLIRYNLGMAWWILTAHEKRHLWQARNVRNRPDFPA